jgi:hypothetical protein
MDELKTWFPKHIAMQIEHNPHVFDYCELSEYLETNAPSDFSWVSEEQKQKAIDSGEMWAVRWYPNTPVGFHELCGADLDVVLEAIRKEYGE